MKIKILVNKKIICNQILPNKLDFFLTLYDRSCYIFCNPNKCNKFAGVLTSGQGGGILPGISVHSGLAADAPPRGGQLPGVRLPHALVRTPRAV